MTDDELAISDVLDDDLKNLANLFSSSADDEAQNVNLSDSLYYTETEFLDLITSRKFSDRLNLTIFSINIANLLTKLRSLKLFIDNIKTSGKGQLTPATQKMSWSPSSLAMSFITRDALSKKEVELEYLFVNI